MKKHSVLWWGLLLLGILCSGILLFQRISAEAADTRACAALSLEDLALLAQKSGLPEETWRGALEEAGVCAFLGDGEAFVIPEDTVPLTTLPLALVENDTRTGVLLPDGLDLDTYEGPLVKALYLYDDYASRATAESAQEIENLLFRGVTDRGLRLLILTPFRTAEGQLILDPAVYTQCLEDLAERLADRGILFGEGFSCLETAPLHPWLTLGAGLVPGMLGVWLVCCQPQRRRWEAPLSDAVAVLLAGLTLLAPDITQRLLMLGAAVLFPCAAAKGITAVARKEPSRLAGWPLPAAAAGVMGLLLAWSLAGGLCVAALMASRAYLMEAALFAGVKAALLLPLLFCAGLLLRQLHWELRTLSPRHWLLLALAITLLVGAGSVLAVRSGDGEGALTTSLRNWLEAVCYARPRTRELLCTAPCVPLFLWACRREVAPGKLFFGVGACLECVSVVNTFCHAVAPVGASCVRSLLAAGLGLVLGLLLAGLLDWLICWYLRRHPGMDQAT